MDNNTKVSECLSPAYFARAGEDPGGHVAVYAVRGSVYTE
ncbi:protein of unknown function [Streptomyces murinus]